MKFNNYLFAIILLSLFGVLAIVSVTIYRPEVDNTALIVAITGFLTPSIGLILAFMIKTVQYEVNSRMGQLLELTKTSSHAEGKLEGKEG